MRNKILIFLFVCLSVLRLEAWLTKIEVTDRFVAITPPSIETVGFAMRNARTGLFHSLVPDACGITAIRITEETARKISAKRFGFFDTAVRRSQIADGVGSVVSFEAWQALNENTRQSLGESLIMAAFSCAGRSKVPSHQIIEGFVGGKGYVSSRGFSDFYIFPDQRLFVHAFID